MIETDRDRNKGFSLIELLLVMVILATLAVIVIPRFTGRSKEAKITAARTTINNLVSSLKMFETDNQRFPTESEGLEALIENPGDLDNWHRCLDSNKVPKDPWGNDYIYVCPGKENEDFDLYSRGPDGIDGNEDDIGNWIEDDDE